MDESRRERWDEICYAEDSFPAYRIELVKAFLRDFPGSGAAWQMLGVELKRVARFAEAEDALRRGLELSGPSSDLYCAMGTVFEYRGDHAAAERWFRKAIEHDPDDATGYIFQGSMWAALGRLAEAEETHRRGTACKTGSVDEAHYNLGMVLRGRGRYAEASACFTEALRLDPQYEVARLAKLDVERAMRVRAESEPGRAP